MSLYECKHCGADLGCYLPGGLCTPCSKAEGLEIMAKEPAAGPFTCEPWEDYTPARILSGGTYWEDSI